MSDVPSKLDALGDLLGVQDDTRDIERPAPRRPVGEILRGGPVPAVDQSLLDVVEADTPVPPVPATESTPTEPRRRSPAARDRARAESVPTRSARREAGQRTSANLPMPLVARLLAAKHRRWELSQLVTSALDNIIVEPAAADELLEQTWPTTRVQRAYQLAETDVGRLDELGERWRMNRSQVISVIVPLEMERLGL